MEVFLHPTKTNTGWGAHRLKRWTAAQTRWWFFPTQLKKYATVKLGIISPSEEVNNKKIFETTIQQSFFWLILRLKRATWHQMPFHGTAGTCLFELSLHRLAGGMSLEPSLPRKRLEPRKLESHPWKCVFMKLIGELNMKLNNKPHQKEMDRFSLMLLVSVASFQKKLFLV